MSVCSVHNRVLKSDTQQFSPLSNPPSLSSSSNHILPSWRIFVSALKSVPLLTCFFLLCPNASSFLSLSCQKFFLKGSLHQCPRALLKFSGSQRVFPNNGAPAFPGAPYLDPTHACEFSGRCFLSLSLHTLLPLLHTLEWGSVHEPVPTILCSQ